MKAKKYGPLTALTLSGDAMLKMLQVKHNHTEDEARKAIDLLRFANPDLFVWLARVIDPPVVVKGLPTKMSPRDEYTEGGTITLNPSNKDIVATKAVELLPAIPGHAHTFDFSTGVIVITCGCRLLDMGQGWFKVETATSPKGAGGSATARPDAYTNACPYDEGQCEKPGCRNTTSVRFDPKCVSTDLHIETLLMCSRLARLAHKGQKGKYGDADQPYTTHIERVAHMVKGNDAKAVAWLHDVLEDTWMTAGDLHRFGVPTHIVQAVEVLTKPKSDTVSDYFVYIRSIKNSGNRLAMSVKLADLRDHLRPDGIHKLPDSSQWKYAHAIKMLLFKEPK